VSGRARSGAALLAAALALLPRCACDVPPDALERCEASQVVPRAVATDILFVIDDSGSMANNQVTLQAGLASFIAALAASPVANDFQIGVTTTSVATFGGTAVAPAGDLVAPGVMPGSSPTLVADFESAVVVGTAGSGREQSFAAARLALEKSAAGSPNAGFLRPGARLAVIFLSDEDDCSGPTDPTIGSDVECRSAKALPSSTLVSPADFAAFLSAPIAGEARDTVVAAIVGVAPGTLEPSCGGAQCANQVCASAVDKGDRFVALLGAAGATRSRLASICDATFDRALAEFAGAIASKSLPLEGAPADWRMLAVRIERPSVGTIACSVAPSDAAASARNAADAIYETPQPGRPASLTFQNDCELQQGDRVDVQVVCVG
jgi:hypothetical protein